MRVVRRYCPWSIRQACWTDLDQHLFEDRTFGRDPTVECQSDHSSTFSNTRSIHLRASLLEQYSTEPNNVAAFLSRTVQVILRS